MEYQSKTISATDKQDFYRQLYNEVCAFIGEETDGLANAANLSAFLYQHLSEVNWVGFYFFRGGELVVGPFQGKPACVRIALGRGVCGTAASRRETLIVPDVHQFPGHIACDSASRSEMVIPLLQKDRLIGVLDIDSPVLNRFDEADRIGLEQIAMRMMNTCRFDF